VYAWAATAWSDQGVVTSTLYGAGTWDGVEYAHGQFRQAAPAEDLHTLHQVAVGHLALVRQRNDLNGRCFITATTKVDKLVTGKRVVLAWIGLALFGLVLPWPLSGILPFVSAIALWRRCRLLAIALALLGVAMSVPGVIALP
jgi:hypothetical protein